MYNANSYWTFIRKDGTHKRPGKKDLEYWDRILLNIARNEIDALLVELCIEGISTFATELVFVIREQIEDMERDIKAHLVATEIEEFREFLDNISLQKDLLEALVVETISKIKEGIM